MSRHASTAAKNSAVFVAGAAAGAVAVYYLTRTGKPSSSSKTKSSSSSAAAGDEPHSISRSTERHTALTTVEADDVNDDVVLRPYEHEAFMKARLLKAEADDPMKESEEDSKVENEASVEHVKANAEQNDITLAQRSRKSKEYRKREAAMERTRVVVRVPATSANMGPGFDCLGLALNIWSEVTIERAAKFDIVYEGEGFEGVPLDETNLLVTGARAAFHAAGKPMPTLRYRCVNRIPYARGVGSSSAAIVAGLIGGLVLVGRRLPMWGHEELLQLACELEGHADNVAPVIYGGCQLGVHNDERWITERVHLPPGIQVVLFIPNHVAKTSEARAILKDNVKRDDAVFSIGRIAWLVLALQSGNVKNLRVGCEDKMHQPQRAKEEAFKHVNPMIDAALSAGADCAYLSGAGPSVAAITSGAAGDIFLQREKERVDKTVAKAMLQAAAAVGVKGGTFITNPTDTGAYVVSAEPKYSEGSIRYSGDV